ncbi:tripartite tricarboxylate transporter permease [uncultured Pseudokineococcus sp.]|uniref:tripartite tricarboxylate transporter permease n=1 Tax=uncultured Pseudokineococcus sp. TaxID=1642928 RepID=UPI002627031F|nr:tripartite tricarboxylate transporter permease [uncultured Pseudokineococcus sp.]
MNAYVDGLAALAEPTTVLCLLAGLAVGTLVGVFPGVTGSMAVALAAGFTLTLEPVQGLAVLLSIYVGANYGDRVPSILINTPGTPAAISTTFDGYPLAKQGKGGLALVVSAFATTGGILVSMVVFVLAAQPIARFALEFGPAEMFALVVFGLTVMISISSRSLLKGALAGVAGLALATVGRDPITGDQRFTFGIGDLSSGLPFIAIIIGLFGIAELLDQILTHRSTSARPVSSLGRYWPTRPELKGLRKPFASSAAIGTFVGVVPAAGGDIAGLVGWDRARRMSKHPEQYGKGSLEGITAADTASSATLGGSLTTTMALGIPGDSVMAVMIGSMVIWGLQPGPALFTQNPDLVASIAGIMVIATVLSLAVGLVRMRGMVRLLDMPQHFLWAGILVFCVVGTYTTANSFYPIWIMLGAGFVGLVLKRTGFPPGPVVLGLLLGPLAESNLRRALLIDSPVALVTQPIAAVLLLLAVLSVVGPLVSRARARRRGRTSEPPTADAPADESDVRAGRR